LYYVKIKSPEMIKKLKKVFPKNWKNMVVVALTISEKNEIKGWDGLDKEMSSNNVKAFTNLIGIL
jgi:hypothetical protein